MSLLPKEKIMKVSQNNNGPDNIIASLNFLVIEAEKCGHESLVTILETALSLARQSNKLSEAVLSSKLIEDSAAQATIRFLLQFLGASQDTQSNVIKTLCDAGYAVQSMKIKEVAES